MQEVIRAKLRKVGTSIGVLIPSEIMRNNNLKAGDEVEVTVWKKPTKKQVMEGLGSAKWLHGWKREKGDMDRF